jgi:ATP-dependent helicase/nuclease subunit A
VTLARALEESGILTFRAFVHWLRDMEEEAVDEAESPTVEEGDDVVRIMSIHAAKGLEFPIVVIPDLGRAPGGRADYLLIQRSSGRAAAYVGKVGDWPIQARDYETFKEHQSSRSVAERLRVLYVAMTRAKDALILPVFPSPSKGSIQEDLSDLLPETPEFGKEHKGWLVVNGEEIPHSADDAPPIRIRLPDGPNAEGESVARERDTWLKARDTAVRSAAVADLVQNPSELIDHEALRALQRKGTSLEHEPGGRALGAMVHAILATIPITRPDLVEDFAAYFARQAGLSDSVAERASNLVRTALASDGIRDPLRARVHREVPFAAVGPEGVTEGAIDMLVERPEGTTVIDFKTDAVDKDREKALEALYYPQLQKYLSVVQQAGHLKVTGRLSFLQPPHDTAAPKL